MTIPVFSTQSERTTGSQRHLISFPDTFVVLLTGCLLVLVKYYWADGVRNYCDTHNHHGLRDYGGGRVKRS